MTTGPAKMFVLIFLTSPVKVLKMFCWSLALKCGDTSTLFGTGTAQAGLIWGTGKGRCVISLVMLEHMDQRCEQGSAVLLPAPSPFAPVDLGGGQRTNLLQNSCFSTCVCKIACCMLALVPGVSQPSLGMLSTQLPSPKHLCVNSVSET